MLHFSPSEVHWSSDRATSKVIGSERTARLRNSTIDTHAFTVGSSSLACWHRSQQIASLLIDLELNLFHFVVSNVGDFAFNLFANLSYLALLLNPCRSIFDPSVQTVLIRSFRCYYAVKCREYMFCTDVLSDGLVQ